MSKYREPYGNDVFIKPGETKSVFGPFLGNDDRGAAHEVMAGHVTCHNDPERNTTFFVREGQQMVLHTEGMKNWLVIRHHRESRDVSIE